MLKAAYRMGVDPGLPARGVRRFPRRLVPAGSGGPAVRDFLGPRQNRN